MSESLLDEVLAEFQERRARNRRRGWGGKREGAGRPKGEPTIRVTIPVSYANDLALMMELGSHGLTKEALQEAHKVIAEQLKLECERARNRAPPDRSAMKVERAKDLVLRLYGEAKQEETKKAMAEMVALLSAHM